MKIKLPQDVLFHHDVQLMVWRPRGVLNEKAVNKILTFMIKKEATSKKPFNRLTETLHVDHVDLNFSYIFHVALFRRLTSAGRPPIKSAILLSSLTKAHYSKLLVLLTQGSPLKVRLFEDRAEAAKWLGVTLETLEY
jgi:hypothetical protein